MRLRWVYFAQKMHYISDTQGYYFPLVMCQSLYFHSFDQMVLSFDVFFVLF